MSDSPLTKLPSNDLSAFRATLSTSKKIIVVAGAGLSSASGIPTFRGSGGLWRKYDALSLANKAAFIDNPSRVWQFYHYRRESARKAEPNAAHLALARFSIDSYREEIAPGSKFTLITQNVDGLSVRALDDVLSELGESSLSVRHDPIQMHGRIFDVVCTNYNCGHQETDYGSPLCSALEGTEDAVEAGAPERDIPKSELPRCSKCGELARPGVVWFGEAPYQINEILELADEADLCLVVGTSSLVHPAAKLAGRVKEHGGKVAVFNIDRSKRDEEADYLFLGPCEKLLPEAFGICKRQEISVDASL